MRHATIIACLVKETLRFAPPAMKPLIEFSLRIMIVSAKVAFLNRFLGNNIVNKILLSSAISLALLVRELPPLAQAALQDIKEYLMKQMKLVLASRGMSQLMALP